ncbi:3838_t:CDS:2, partial [Acaulospora colombiana]
MSPDEAARTFTYIWRYAFQESPEDIELSTKILSESTSRIDAHIATNTSRLDSMMRVLLEEKGLKKRSKLLDDVIAINSRCRTFVCASPVTDASMNQLFRTYKTSFEAPIDVTVVQAVRATCAMPGWFTPSVIGERLQTREYIACQNTLTNPVKVVLRECNDIFGPERR